MPKVYNKRKGNFVPAGAIYVGRGSPWGNPFKIGIDGTRQEVIAMFKVYAIARLKSEPDWLLPLQGKDLVCWCSPQPCHADILIKLANGVPL